MNFAIRANRYAWVLERNACSAKKYDDPAPGYSFDSSAYAIAVARHSTTAAAMPNHIPCAARGAISAIAFEVRPVNPSVVGGLVGVSEAMRAPLSVSSPQSAVCSHQSGL